MNCQSDHLAKEENTLYRKVVGQLTWLAGMSKPDIIFHVCEASAKLNKATAADIIIINKTMYKLNLHHHPLRYLPSILTIKSFSILLMQALMIYQMEEAKDVKLYSLLRVIVALFTGIHQKSRVLLNLL